MVSIHESEMQAYEELLARKREIEQKIAEADARWKQVHIAEIKALMTQHSLTLQDIGAKSTKRAPAATKYADGQNKWSGRGRVPRWLVGKDREQYRVQT